jgi:uncharacterized protein
MKIESALDWANIHHSLNERGFAKIPEMLPASECMNLRDHYPNQDLYRKTINMHRYRFGKGEYKYYQYPLPPVIESLREKFYTPLATLANVWMKMLNIPIQYPLLHKELLTVCQQHGQSRPTPLILKYEASGYNTLHQDLYGDIYFPFQIVIALSKPGMEFQGGEFVLTEQIPRAQSRAQVLQVNQGDALIFTTNFKPTKGTRGYYRTNMKHGISEVTSGTRYALGIIFHDAK